jgi:dienelactone hydrolase
MAGMAKMLWDGIRAVDVLADWPEVDMSRIGAMGHSLGAKETLYLAAFDPRVRAAISSEGGVGLRMSNWDAPWYLGDAIPPEGSGVDHDQLLALVAPRAFLLVGGGDSDSETSRHFIESARNVYREFGREDALEFLLHAAGHDFPDAMRERAFAWLDRHLAPVP